MAVLCVLLNSFGLRKSDTESSHHQQGDLIPGNHIAQLCSRQPVKLKPYDFIVVLSPSGLIFQISVLYNIFFVPQISHRLASSHFVIIAHWSSFTGLVLSTKISKLNKSYGEKNMKKRIAGIVNDRNHNLFGSGDR